MVDIVVKAIISKEQGRKFIKNTPIDLFQKISDYSRRKGKDILKYAHYELINDKFNTIVNTQLSILSLFNDVCVFCNKPFTHYIVGKPIGGIYKHKYYYLYPIRFENNGDIVYYNIDHILPKSLGGANRLENYQLSCENMNSKKGDILSEEDKKYGIKINKQ